MAYPGSRRRTWSRFVLVFLAVAGCGGDGSAPAGPTDDDPPAPPAPTGPVSASVGPEGGSISAVTDEGVRVTLDLPPGALRSTTELTLRPTAPEGAALLSVGLEPAGLVLLEDASISVDVPDAIDGTEHVLYFGTPSDPVVIATSYGASSKTLGAEVRSLGLADGPVRVTGAPTRSSGPFPASTTGGGQLGAAVQTCQQIAARAEASFDSYLVSGSPKDAIKAALQGAASLQKNGCAEAQDFLRSAGEATCTRLGEVIQTALSESIASYGDFDESVSPILGWAAAVESLGGGCPASDDFLTAVDAEVSDFLVWYGSLLDALTSPDFQTFVALKAELFSLVGVLEQAFFLGLDSAAERIEARALAPTLVQMRSVAYALAETDRWHFALTKLTTFGFYANRDILGVADPRTCDTTLNPPQCQQVRQDIGYKAPAPFQDADIYGDLHFAGTSLELDTRVRSGGVWTSGVAGGGVAPGQEIDALTLDTPTRGTLSIGGVIDAMTCFTTDEDADSEVVIALAGTELVTLRRPIGGHEYLQGTPVQFDLEEAAVAAGIQASEGSTHTLTVTRTRTGCNDELWGPRAYPLLSAELKWINPTAETDVTLPGTVAPGDTVDVEVRVKVIDQLGQAGFFDAIDLVLNSSGGTLLSSSGQTDVQGSFQTRVVVDAAQPSPGPEGQSSAVLSVQATATLKEGVTAQGSATSLVGSPGRAVLEFVSHTARVRTRAFGVDQDEEDYVTTAGSWSYSNSLSVDETTAQGSITAQVQIDAGSNVSVSGDELVSVTGSVNGSQSWSASGETSGFSFSDAESGIRFEVVGGSVPFTLSGGASVSGSWRTFIQLSGPVSYGFDVESPNQPGGVQESGLLPPGTYWLDVFWGNKDGSCLDCSIDASGSLSYSLTLGGN